MPNLRGAEWIILIGLVVLLFGAKRLPDAARGLGRSLRIFKAETKGLVEGEGAKDAELPAGGAGSESPELGAGSPDKTEAHQPPAS